MESIPLRASERTSSSTRSSLDDIAVLTSPRHSTTPLREDITLRHSHSSGRGSLDDLDVEDPLSRVYVIDDEFEPFSRTEKGFIGVSCLGVVAVPLLYLIVSKVKVSPKSRSVMLINRDERDEQRALFLEKVKDYDGFGIQSDTHGWNSDIFRDLFNFDGSWQCRRDQEDELQVTSIQYNTKL